MCTNELCALSFVPIMTSYNTRKPNTTGISTVCMLFYNVCYLILTDCIYRIALKIHGSKFSQIADLELFAEKLCGLPAYARNLLKLQHFC